MKNLEYEVWRCEVEIVEVLGRCNAAGDRDDYYFEGSAGQTITIRMDKRDSNLDTFVELYNSDGTLLGHDDDGGIGYNSRLAITLRQNGRHKIIARGHSNSIGGYRLTLSRESTDDPDDNRWIAFGRTLQGTISPDNDRDWYHFSATAGRVVSIRMEKIDSGLDSFLELYDSTGTRIAYNDDTGNDTITFSSVQARYVGMYGVQRGTPWGVFAVGVRGLQHGGCGGHQRTAGSW